MQDGMFWLGDQLRGRYLRAGQARILDLLRSCYLLSLLKFLSG